MEKNLKELSPRRVWEKFYEITRVPRPSHHEDAIREYLLAEAHTHGIEAEAAATVVNGFDLVEKHLVEQNIVPMGGQQRHRLLFRSQ